jgi:hypothetical protein
MKKTRIACALIPVFASAGANAYYEGSSAYAAGAFFGYSAGNQYFVEGGSGADDTFIGFAAGFHTNDGSGNTFVGRSAGFANTSGSNNVFIGMQAGLANTTQVNNTFVGALAGTASTGPGNTFIGAGSGGANTTGNSNVFVGSSTGAGNTTGHLNTFLGTNAGNLHQTGNNNTSLGALAGYSNSTGTGNVFVGYKAGYSEAGSNKLYVDNCYNGTCNAPLIYGEFDTYRIQLNGMTEVHNNGQAKSQLNFSKGDVSDTGGYLTSVSDNNFFTSSGARYDGTLAAPNQWVQRSPDGNSVIAGSGGAGYRIFTSSGKTVGNGFAPTVRLHIDYAGEFGINQPPVAGHEIHTSSGAYLASGTWTNASSRAYKHDIRDLSGKDAEQALAGLNPVQFRYNDDDDQQHVGFIAEDVPELVAMKDRKGLSPMDIVAVLTKVVQEKSQAMERQQAEIESLRKELHRLAEEVHDFRSK